LLEVGRSIDQFGNPHTGIEPGELDQAQHDAVRDVFYVSDAAMFVRADLFHELGGFDASRFPGAEDIDLCWRARLAGARVLVAPEARVQQPEAARNRAGGAAVVASTTATCAGSGREVRGCAGSWPSTWRPTTACAPSPTRAAPPSAPRQRAPGSRCSHWPRCWRSSGSSAHVTCSPAASRPSARSRDG